MVFGKYAVFHFVAKGQILGSKGIVNEVNNSGEFVQ